MAREMNGGDTGRGSADAANAPAPPLTITPNRRGDALTGVARHERYTQR